jgi:hypothetical protein
LQLADQDDIDTLSGAWLGLARASQVPFEDAQRHALLQLLARLETRTGRLYYALYVQRLHEALTAGKA